MDRNDILRTRIKRAVDNGFVLHPYKHFMARDRQTGEMYGYESIIFDHSFAKAIWGEKDDIWLGNLENMVAYEDPLEYLAANS